MKKVLVAGATGYLGKFVVCEFKKRCSSIFRIREMLPGIRPWVEAAVRHEKERRGDSVSG